MALAQDLSKASAKSSRQASGSTGPAPGGPCSSYEGKVPTSPKPCKPGGEERKELADVLKNHDFLNLDFPILHHISIFRTT